MKWFSKSTKFEESLIVYIGYIIGYAGDVKIAQKKHVSLIVYSL